MPSSSCQARGAYDAASTSSSDAQQSLSSKGSLRCCQHLEFRCPAVPAKQGGAYDAASSQTGNISYHRADLHRGDSRHDNGLQEQPLIPLHATDVERWQLQAIQCTAGGEQLRLRNATRILCLIGCRCSMWLGGGGGQQRDTDAAALRNPMPHQSMASA